MTTMIGREPTPSRDAEARRGASALTGRAAAQRQLLAAVDDLVAARVAQVGAMLAEVGGDAAAYGGHGLDLGGQLRRLTAVPGKRVRPLLALAGHQAAGGGSARTTGRIASSGHVVRLAAALELLHLFALVHDDVMDRSATRRGLETTHELAARRHREGGARGDAERFGDSVAILLGDLLLAEASNVVADLPRPVRHAWRRTVVELVHGQLLDVTATASRTPPDADASTLVARLKTGRYTVRRPVELGALLVTEDARVLHALATWGDLVGDAFGLRDDVLGVWGDPAVTGKPAFQDLADGTATRVLAWAAETLHGDDAALLHRCRAGGLDAARSRVLAAAMDRAGVCDRAEAEIGRLLDAAGATLSGCESLDDHQRDRLDHLAVLLARRER